MGEQGDPKSQLCLSPACPASVPGTFRGPESRPQGTDVRCPPPGCRKDMLSGLMEVRAEAACLRGEDGRMGHQA